jgi:non-heme chloroperoxidase
MNTRRDLLRMTAAATCTAALPALARSQDAAARVKSNEGVQLYVKEWGQGRPVVLTHAWPLSADCWEHHACVLADAGYRVIAYDRRGFGRSSQPYTGYDYDTLADDLAGVIERSGARDVTLVGYSMGGGEIVRYLSRHGSKNVAKVALVASIVPGIVKTERNPKGLERAVFDGIRASVLNDKAGFLAELLASAFYDVGNKNTHAVSAATVDASWQMAMQAGLRALVGCVDAFGGVDFRPELAAVDVPTLILHGTADKPVPIELSARQAAAGIAGAKLIEYAGASHGILVTERERVTRDLLAFLAE